MSRKLFKGENPMGETLEVGGQELFKVTGVFVNNASRSHVSIDYLVSFENLERLLPGTSLSSNWGQFNYFAYVLLSSPDPIQELVVENKIAATVISLDEENDMQLKELNLQPLQNIHFAANRGNAKPSYDRKYLYVYSAVALAILLISIINFINLTVAASTKRIKEVGVRKVVGAGRSQLIFQYISESLLTTILALGLALFITKQLLLPATNNILQSNITLNLSDPRFVIVMSALTKVDRCLFFIRLNA